MIRLQKLKIDKLIRDGTSFALGLDGGPGSGNFGHKGRPGQQGGSGGGGGSGGTSTSGEKAGLAERAKFFANVIRPEEKVHKQGRKRMSNSEVERNNRERADWHNLTTAQKIHGASEQSRHMRQIKHQAYREAARGNLEGARAIMKKYRHYWNNDPESAMRVQSEMLARQKKT